MRGLAETLVEDRRFSSAVMVAVIANALVLGLDTYAEFPVTVHRAFAYIDEVFVAFFVFEQTLKLYAWRRLFFDNAWNVFDLSVVTISLLAVGPFAPLGPFSVLRILRVLRALRLVSVIPSLRRVVEALIRAVPGISAILGVLTVFFYIGAVMTTSLYGADHKELFGSLGASVVTLFQLMIFDGWAGEVVRTVGATHPGSQIFFMVFTIVTGFAVLNLFIAVMVDALRAEHDRLETGDIEAIEQGQQTTAREVDEVEQSVRALEAKVDAMMEKIETMTAALEKHDRGNS
jgi:voltage-gated sodium channel